MQVCRSRQHHEGRGSKRMKILIQTFACMHAHGLRFCARAYRVKKFFNAWANAAQLRKASHLQVSPKPYSPGPLQAFIAGSSLCPNAKCCLQAIANGDDYVAIQAFTKLLCKYACMYGYCKCSPHPVTCKIREPHIICQRKKYMGGGACIYIHTHTIHIHISMYVCMYVCMYVGMYVCR